MTSMRRYKSTGNPLGRLRRTHYSSQLGPDMEGRRVTIMGWVQRIRRLGRLTFLLVRDREGLTQCTVHHDQASQEVLTAIGQLDNEYAVAVVGLVKGEPKARRGFELIPEHIIIVNDAPPKLPLDTSGKVEADLSTRLDNRVIDLRRHENQLIFKIQHFTISRMRRYLESKGFREIHTPKIVAAATEGGANLFPVTYFERQAFLAQSPQFYKQLCLVAGFDRVYEVGPVYRAEEHNTPRHLNEYTSFDLEMAWIRSEEDVMHMEELMLRHAFTAVRKYCGEELEQLGAEVREPRLPIRRIPFHEALEILREEGLDIPPDSDIPSEGEMKLYHHLREETGEEFFFITRYPASIRPFYTMPLDSDPTLTRSFDLIYRGMEVTTGGQRIHRHDLLVEQIKARGLDPESFSFYTEPFRYGAPPHGGLGLGMERLTMQMLGYKNIREVCLFPRDRTRLTP